MVLMLDEAIKGNFINVECKEMYPSFSDVDELLYYIEYYEKMDLSKMKNK